MAMTALAIVELLNVIEDLRVGDIARFVDSLSEKPAAGSLQTVLTAHWTSSYSGNRVLKVSVQGWEVHSSLTRMALL